jgi:hypothetical protein
VKSGLAVVRGARLSVLILAGEVDLGLIDIEDCCDPGLLCEPVRLDMLAEAIRLCEIDACENPPKFDVPSKYDGRLISIGVPIRALSMLSSI